MNSPAVPAEPEKASAQMRTLEHALSHDVAGSLRGIRSLAKILLQKHDATLPGEAGDLIRLMGDESDRVCRLLEATLEWARCCRLPHSPSWQDTEAIAREAFSSAAAKRPSSTVILEVQPLPLVWADQDSLRRVLRELFANALKFTRDQATPSVSISGRESDTETVITVRDNGVGFDMAHTRQLFSLFQRLHRKQGFEGDGAGLAIARLIVDRHGGSIWCESSVGQGAALHFTLPKPRLEAVPTAATSVPGLSGV